MPTLMDHPRQRKRVLGFFRGDGQLTRAPVHTSDGSPCLDRAHLEVPMKRFEALTHGFLRVRCRRGGHGVHDEIDPVLVIQLPHIPVTDQVLEDSYRLLPPDRYLALRPT